MKGQGLCGTDGVSIQKEIERKKTGETLLRL